MPLRRRLSEAQPPPFTGQVRETLGDCCLFLGGSAPVLGLLQTMATADAAALDASGQWVPLEGALSAMIGAVTLPAPAPAPSPYAQRF